MNQNEGLVSGEPSRYTEAGADPRRANVPPCKPIFYHNLNEMPTQSSRSVVRKALIGWFAFTFVIIFNFIAMSALEYTPIPESTSNIKVESTGYATSWIVSLILMLLAPPFMFAVYMCLYTAARKTSSLYYCCFFPLFAGCCIIFLCWAIGVPDWGGSGLLQLIPAAGAGLAMTPAVFVGVAMALWILATLYGVYLLFLVRNEYNGAGGMKAAKKEATRAAAETAYDNRETIKDVAWEHRDEIKQAAVDNKDLIVEVARENQDVAVKVAQDNPDLAWQAAVAAAQSSQGAPTTQSSNTSNNNADEGDLIDWSNFS